MMISSAASIASWRFLGGAIGNERVAQAARDLRLVVHDDRPGAPLGGDLRHDLRQVRVLVVADDGDDVALLDGEAGVDDELRVLADLGVGTASVYPPASSTALAAQRRQHVAREPLHLPELVERAEATDEVVDAGCRERPEPLDDLLGRPDGTPVGEVHGLGQLRVVLRDVLPEGARWRASSESPMLSVTW